MHELGRQKQPTAADEPQHPGKSAAQLLLCMISHTPLIIVNCTLPQQIEDIYWIPMSR